MKKILILLATYLITGSSAQEKKISHDYDLDVIGGLIITPLDDKAPTIGSGVTAKYSSKTSFNKVYIPLNLEIDGYTNASEGLNSPIDAMMYPVNTIVSGGLGFDGVVKLEGQAFTNLMMNNKELALPPSSSEKDEYNYGSLKHYNRFGGDVRFKLPLEKFNLNVFSHNNVVSYHYSNDCTNVYHDDLDHDWWITPGVSYKVLDVLSIKGEYLRKNELDNRGTYDIDMAWIGLETNLKVLKRKMLRIYGDLNGRYYRSDIMAERGYLDNGEKTGQLGMESHIRAFLKLKKKLYIKGDLLADISSLMQKQRYELAIRKVSKKGQFSGEGGCWGTFGSLFPRLCGYGRGRLGVNEYFAFLPQAKVYFRWNDEAYSYYRADLGLELEGRLPVRPEKIFTSLYLLGGADYKMFSWDDYTYDNKLSNSFPTHLNLYLGLRTYL